MPLVAPEPIESPRLVVRLLDAQDLPALLEVNRDDEVTRHLPYATWASMADADAWLARMAALQSTGLALQFVIVSKALRHAIGTCLLFRFAEGSGRAELGYALGRAHWGQGLMEEALTALLDTGFGPMGLRRVEAEVDVRNRPSAALLQRLGFTKEGVLRERWLGKDATAGDFDFFGLLRKEWRQEQREVRSDAASHSHERAVASFVYRAAGEADLPAICALGQVVNLLHHEAWPQIFAPASAPERDLPHWRQCVGGEGFAAFVAEDGSTLAGFVTVNVVAESHSLMQPLRYARVGTVCVRGEARGQGVGSALMARAEAWAIAQGAVDVRLNVWAFNQPALALYQELGYEVRSLALGKALPRHED